MKPRESALKALRRDVEEQARKVEDLERIIREFDTMAADLERQIRLEEDRTGIRDAAHFSYSTFAKAAAQRRDKLRNSMEGLHQQLEAAVKTREEMSERMTRAVVQAESQAAGNAGGSRRRLERSPLAAAR